MHLAITGGGQTKTTSASISTASSPKPPPPRHPSTSSLATPCSPGSTTTETGGSSTSPSRQECPFAAQHGLARRRPAPAWSQRCPPHPADGDTDGRCFFFQARMCHRDNVSGCFSSVLRRQLLSAPRGTIE